MDNKTALPCPFCGQEAVPVGYDFDPTTEQVECQCGAQGPFATQDSAARYEAWNGRIAHWRVAPKY